MKRKFTVPEGLRSHINGTPEHTCWPLSVNNVLIATCRPHYGRPPVLRNGKR